MNKARLREIGQVLQQQHQLGAGLSMELLTEIDRLHSLLYDIRMAYVGGESFTAIMDRLRETGDIHND